MWNRLSGKKTSATDDMLSHGSRRNDEEERSKRSGSGSVKSSSSNKKSSSKGDDQLSKPSKKSSSRGDDRERGSNPTSSSYSSTAQSAYPGNSSASTASASRSHGDLPADLVRDDSLVDRMPKTRSSRDERDGERDSDLRSERRRTKDGLEKRPERGEERRENGDRRTQEDRGYKKRSSRSGENADEHRGSDIIENTRGPADFPDQVGATGFSQFPGQYEVSVPHPGGAATHPISSHVQDQFPGQFPVQSTAPYRPPIAISEGGPGLAAEYYGDAGESVAQQPGNRTNTPSLIIGAEPHLQPALAVAAPPPEPSASGGVGAAASFFTGEFDDEVTTSLGQQTSSTYATAQIKPNSSQHSSSAQILPTLGGAAAGFVAASQTSSHSQRPNQGSSVEVIHSEDLTSAHQRPPSPTAVSYHSNSSRPPRPAKQSSQSSNIPMLAVGAAGLAAAISHESNHAYHQQGSPNPQYPTTSMVQQHRHRGPLEAIVDFFRDPDAVAQFEEYSEITGICRYCFEPGSTPRDAPRKHHYRRRRSNEKLGRVDKDSRYNSSENESSRKKNKSWLATGLAGYGLAKVGENLFKQKNDFDDTYSLKSGRRQSPERRGYNARRRSRSKDRIETGISSDGKFYKKESHGGLHGGFRMTTYEDQRHSRHSRSSSRSRERKSSQIGAVLGTTLALEGGQSSSRRRKSTSPKGAIVRTRQRKGERSPERRPKSHKKKKSRGFFSLGSASSSSSLDLPHDYSRHHGNKRPGVKSRDDEQAEAALMGLGAAAAALALKDDRGSHKKKDIKKLVGVKETKERHTQGFSHDRRSEEEIWESAPENEYDSADSGLVYGLPRRRGSRDSLSSQTSGTDKWGWRWGNSKRKDSSPKRASSEYSNSPPITGFANVSMTGETVMSPDQYQGAGMDSTSSLPLQQVFPIPTSDPTRFDVGREGSLASSDRPTVVPIQHPQPITPVSAALYSSQAPYEHSHNAPMGPLVLPNPQQPSQPIPTNAPIVRPDLNDHDRFAQDFPQPKHVKGGSMLRRADSSPAQFGPDEVSDSLALRRRSSTKDDVSTVRFERTEEEEENDRRERRRKRREDRERRETAERERTDDERRFSKDEQGWRSESTTKRKESPEKSSTVSWIAPVAAGVVGAVVGAAAAGERSRPEETREERRERRRKERKREEAEDEEASQRRERRRKERESRREREADQNTRVEGRNFSDGIPEAADNPEQPTLSDDRKETSIWQEAASPKKSASHENYGDFFRPLDLSNEQVKTTSANTNADVDFDQAPAIVTVVPKGFRDPDAQPVFSPADTDEKIDISNLSFPVPKLRLVEPTPPSSRGSTPTIRPQETTDDVIENSRSDPSPPKVTWANDESREYSVNAPNEDQPEYIEPAHNEIEGPDLAGKSRPADASVVPELQDREINGQQDIKTSNGSASYADDMGFVATLAASAEDAGFDPSIIINDPNYRRTDSPPEANNRSMPGAFDDEDDNGSTLNKRERKKKNRDAKSQGNGHGNALEGRNDDAVVQDIINQVENSEPQAHEQDVKDDFNDDWKDSKKPKSKRSKKGRKDSGSKDDFFEALESTDNQQMAESRDLYDRPTGETPSTASRTPLGNDEDNAKKSRKKSKRDITTADDTASNVSLPSTSFGSNGPKSTSKGKSKGSMWDSVVGRSGDNDSQGYDSLATTNETKIGDFEEPKKNGKKSKKRRSNRDKLDDEPAITDSSTTKTPSEQQESSVDITAPDSNGFTQDPPVKVCTAASSRIMPVDLTLIVIKESGSSRRETSLPNFVVEDREDANEPEPIHEARAESFLDMRPEPPRPPDIFVQKDKPPIPSETVELPDSPRSPPEDQTRRSFETHTQEPLSSPTAVPFDFRFSRPRPLIGSNRSRSQTPLPSHASTGHTPKSKPRPRSTEFTSSKEFRPLMLVERHRSHQDSASKETYPSLPSSRTTSRNSSVQDPEEGERDIREMTEANPGYIKLGHTSSTDADHPISQPDLLDSQQSTPTASSFPHPIVGQVPNSPRDSRASSSSRIDKEIGSTSIPADAATGAVIGVSASSALDSTSPGDNPSLPSLPHDEQDDFRQSLEMMNSDTTDPEMKEKAVAQEDLTTQVGEAWPTLAPAQGQLDHRQDVPDSSPGVGDNNANEVKNDSPRDESDFPREQSQEESKEQGVNEAVADGTGVKSFEKDAELEREPNLEEEFALPKTKKGKKGKSKADKSESSQESVKPSISRAAVRLDDKAVDVLSPEETRQIQEQDTQDAVDSWFSPIINSKKSKKQQKKEVIEQHPEMIKIPLGSDHTPEKDVRLADVTGTQVTEELTPDASSEQTSDMRDSTTQGSERAEDDSPQFVHTQSRGAVESQLERRQSKPKAKKGKKGRKGASQHKDSQLASETTEENNLSDRPLGQSAESRAEPAQAGVTASPNESNQSFEQPERASPLDPMSSPSAVPLPIDDDLDLHGEDEKDLEIGKRANLDSFPAASSPKNVAVQTQIPKDDETVDPPQQRLQDIDQGSDEASVYRASTLEMSASHGPSKSAELGKGAPVSENDQHETIYMEPEEQAAHSIDTSREEATNPSDVAENILGTIKQSHEPDGGTGARGKIESSWPGALREANDGRTVEMSKLSEATNSHGDLASQPDSGNPQIEPEIAEDEWTGIGRKKKTKKAKSARSDLVNDTAMGVEAEPESHPHTSHNLLQHGQPTNDDNKAGVGHPQEETKVAEDEWPSSKTKKETKKKKKNQKSRIPDLIPEPIDRQSSREGPGLIEEEAVELQTPRLRNDNERKADEGAASSAARSTPQEVATMLEPEAAQPSFAKVLDETPSGAPSFEYSHQKAIIDQHAEEDNSSPIDGHIFEQSSKDLESNELELIDQYHYKDDLNEQTLPVEENDRSQTRETETQKLELIDQYGEAETTRPSTDLSTNIVNALHEVPIVADKETPVNTLNHRATAVEPILAYGPSADQAVSEKYSGDPDRESKSADSNTARNDTKGEVLLPGESKVDGPMQASVHLEPGVPLDPKDAAWVTKEPSPQIARKDQENNVNSLQRATSDQKIGSDANLGTSEVLPEAKLDSRDVGIEMASPAKEHNAEEEVEGLQQFDPSASLEPIQLPEATDNVEEGEPKIIQELQPLKKKKDKKKAKRARALMDEENEAVSIPEEKSLQTNTNLDEGDPGISTKPDIEKKNRPPETSTARSKNKKDRKKNKKAQSLPWEDDEASVPSQPESQQQRISELHPGETKAVEGTEERPPGDPSPNDDYIEPSSGIPRAQDAEDQTPAEPPDNIVVDRRSPERATTPSVHQAQKKVYEASENQSQTGEDSTYGPEVSNLGKEKREGAHSSALDDTETRREPEKASHASLAEDVHYQPSILPISEDRENWSRQERLVEEVKPTEVVEPEDSLPVTQDYKGSSKDEPKEAAGDYMDQSAEAPVEDPIHRKKSKKEKKMRKERLEDTSSLDPIPNPTSATDPLISQEQSFGEHVKTFGEAVEVSLPSTSGNAGTPSVLEYEWKEEPFQMADTQVTSDVKAEDEIRDLHTQKRASQDAGQKRPKENFELLKSAVQESPELTQDLAKSELEKRSAEGEADDEYFEAHALDSRTDILNSELLSATEQHSYDLQYTQELEKLGVESPRSSRVDLPTSAAKAEVPEHEEPASRDFEYSDHSQPTEVGVHRSPARLAVHEEAFEGGAGEPDDGRERELENPKVFEQQSKESLQSPVPDSPVLTTENERLRPQEQDDEDQSSARDFQHQDIESPQIPAKDLPTPAADIELLDAQEQREYDNAYAKELERQLSPLEHGKQAGSTVDKADAPSISPPSMDSLVSLPLEQRTTLAKPPPLEDILEEPRSRPSSAQEVPLDCDEESSTLKPPKKSKKGKKGRKQQQPIIWEDDTATPPISNETDHGEDALVRSTVLSSSEKSGDAGLPISLEEPVQDQHVEESSTSLTDGGKTKSQINSDDYFTIHPSTVAEQDIGMDPEIDEFRTALSTELEHSTREELPEKAGQSSSKATQHPLPQFSGDERTGAESLDPYDQLQTAPTQIEEQASDDLSYTVTKNNKKGKKSKRKTVERTPSPSAMISEKLPEPSRSSEITAKEDIAEPDPYPEQSPQRERPPKAEPMPSTDTKSKDNIDLASGIGLGAAASMIGGLTRQESKKGGKKGKKGKKAKWVDLDEIPSSDNAVPAEDVASLSAERGQTLEQESTNIEEEDKKDKVPRSPIPSTTSTAYEPMETDTSDRLSKSHGSSYRDSAINVSDSPVISEETPSVHRPIRDSGYPETETSPTFTTERDDRSPLAEEDWDRKPSEQEAQENDPVFGTPKRGRSPFGDQSNVSADVDAAYGSPPEKQRKRPRRSRSYDSDDSADSGFDIQRRRRQEATNQRARDPSPVSSTTKDRSSALFDSSPSAREEMVDRSGETHASTANGSVRPEPSWSFSQGGSPQPRSRDPSERAVYSRVAEPSLDQTAYHDLAGDREEPPESIFGGPIRPDEDIISEPRSPTVSETRGRLQRLETISENGQDKLSSHTKDKNAIPDMDSPEAEAGIKEDRVLSPPATVHAEGHLSQDHLDPAESRRPSEDQKISSDSNQSHSHSQPSDPIDLPSVPSKPREGEYRTASAASMQSDNSIHAIIRTPDQIRSASGQSFRSSGTPPLRRVDRSVSGDLRGASKLKVGEAKTRAKTSQAESEAEAELELDPSIPSSSTYDPVTDKGKSRADMVDVYVSIPKKDQRTYEANTYLQEGWGDVRGQSPMSPTRPPSMRKRQSMQLLDLETRLDQLVSENRLLESQKSNAERILQDQARDHSQQRHAYEEALQEHKIYLTQKDSELNELRDTLEEWQSKVNQLTEINENLTASHTSADEHDQRYRELEDEHVHLKERHTELTTGMEALVQREVAFKLEAKNSELHQLRTELESAKQQVRNLQQQLSASRDGEGFVERDEDYFDGQCQSLCQHVQQWVLRFSKFSDMKACYHASEIRDEAKVDRMENAILDGTDVDIYLQDRVKRRDVFMAVVMTMIFDYIFTRYLFGMDREQRQKLKNLEKTLQEIGPMSAVCKWRATTLTLLMRREDFARQRATDTEAIVHEIFDTLATFLPPPSHLVSQIQDSLRKVINAAADLSIEMRTQRADYQMLPPLQPDYDTNGDLAQKVYFNALTMNERSGATTSNQALQEQGAVVRMVLFPLVVKNEEDDEQIIVCPAQVLTASSKGKKTVRVMSVQGSTQGGRSEASFADMNMEGGMI